MNKLEIQQEQREDKKQKLLSIILQGLEKKYGKDSRLFQSYSNPNVQEKLSLDELEIVASLYTSEEVEQQSQAEKITTTVQNFINNQETVELFHLFKQREFGKGKYHKWDVVEHTQNTLFNFRDQLQHFDKRLNDHFNTRLDGITKHQLMELAIIFHDAGKMDVYNKTGSMRGHAAFTIQHQLSEISHNFQLTHTQREYVKNIIAFHDLPPEQLTPAERQYLIDNNYYIEYLLISVSDLKATQWPAYDPQVWTHREQFVHQEIKKLLDQEITQLSSLL